LNFDGIILGTGIMNFTRIRTVAHRAFAGFMAIWLSGFVFLFCCDDIRAQMTEAESCPLAKMSMHCDKSGNQHRHSVQQQTSEREEFDCCGFIPILLDKTRMVDSNDQIAVCCRPLLSKTTSGRGQPFAVRISYRVAVQFRTTPTLRTAHLEFRKHFERFLLLQAQLPSGTLTFLVL
jgi:hypothetical protein